MSTDKKRKAYNIDFGTPPIATHSEGNGYGKKKAETAPGILADFMLTKDATMIENEALKAKVAEFDGASVTRKISCNLIKRSHWANRDQAGLTDENEEFLGLKKEIEAAGGNVQPIKVRPVSGVFPQSYEIVFGHRRYRACSDLGLDVLAVIEQLDDRALFIEMDRENRQRADLRPYEQGLMYKRALDEGLFSSQNKLAEALGIEAGTASKAISLAKLPKNILDSFKSPLDIQFRWAVDLKAAYEKEPDVVLARADDIIAKRASGEIISSHDAFNALAGKAEKSAVLKPRVVKVGDRLLSITERGNRVLFDLDRLAVDKLSKIERFIAEMMAE